MGVRVNLQKAKVIHKELIKSRVAFLGLVQKCNEEHQRLIDEGQGESTEAQKIVAMKRKLRNLHENDAIENATSFEELKKYWPEEIQETGG